MSTKIYSGYRLQDGVDMFDVVKKTRATFQELLQRKAGYELLSDIVFAYDQLKFSDELAERFRKGNDLSDKVNEWAVRYKMCKNLSENMERYPKHYQVSLGFAPDPVTGKMLVYYFGPGEMEEVFEGFEEVEEYGYWNNSEQPDGINDEEWQEHREAWDRVLGHLDLSVAMVMSNAVTSSELSPLSFSYEKMEKLGILMPSRASRVRNLTEILATQNIDFSKTDNPFALLNAALRDAELMKETANFVEENLGADLTFADMVAWRTEEH